MIYVSPVSLSQTYMYGKTTPKNDLKVSNVNFTGNVSEVASKMGKKFAELISDMEKGIDLNFDMNAVGQNRLMREIIAFSNADGVEKKAQKALVDMIIDDKKTDINIRDKNGRNALHHVCMGSSYGSGDMDMAYDLIVKILKKDGNTFFMRDNEGRPPFTYIKEPTLRAKVQNFYENNIL